MIKKARDIEVGDISKWGEVVEIAIDNKLNPGKVAILFPVNYGVFDLDEEVEVRVP